MIIIRTQFVVFLIVLYSAITVLARYDDPNCGWADQPYRAVGDWAIDAGSDSNWNVTEPLGLMHDTNIQPCEYAVDIHGLQPNKVYRWKVTVGNSWNVSHGCFGTEKPNCVFSTSTGSVRLKIIGSFTYPLMYEVIDGSPTPTIPSSESTDSPFDSLESTDYPIDYLESTDSPIDPLESTDYPIDYLESTDSPIDYLESTDSPIDYLESTEPAIESLESTDTPIDSVISTDYPIDYRESTDYPIDYLESTYSPIDTLESTDDPIDYLQSTDSPVDYLESTDSPIGYLESTEPAIESLESTDTPIDSVISTDYPTDYRESTDYPIDYLESTYSPIDTLESTDSAFESLESTDDPIDYLQSTDSPVDYLESTDSPIDYLESTDYPIDFSESTDSAFESSESTDYPIDYLESTDSPVDYLESTDYPIDYLESTDSPVDYLESTDYPIDFSESTDSTTPSLESTDSTSPTPTVDSSTSSPSFSNSNKKVFAHFMVGFTYSSDKTFFDIQIKRAKSAGIDGFALNVGNDSWQPDRVAEALDAAKDNDNFTMFISFNISSLTTNYDVLSQFHFAADHPNYFKVNDQPFFSTLGGEHEDDFWDDWKNSSGLNPYFCPSWPSYSTHDLLQSHPVADCIFTWNAWPAPNSGPGSTFDTTGDRNLLASANATGKTYMASVAPWFYTHVWGQDWYKNWIFGSEKLLPQRWQQIVSLQPDFVQMITWNDYTQSSYICPIDSDIPIDIAGVNDMINKPQAMHHDAWLELSKHYIQWYKNNARPTVTHDQFYWWYRIHPKNNVTGDLPQNRDDAEDCVVVHSIIKSVQPNGGEYKVVVDLNGAKTIYVITQLEETVCIPFPADPGYVTISLIGPDNKIWWVKGNNAPQRRRGNNFNAFTNSHSFPSP